MIMFELKLEYKDFAIKKLMRIRGQFMQKKLVFYY